ncbi:MAG: Ig-like domain-containing protein, partial [Oscillospiraceae bacterium]
MRDDRSVKTRKTNDFSKIIRHVISQARKGSQKHIAIVAGVVLLLVLIVAGAIWGITSMVGGNDAEPDPEDKIEVKIDPEADNKYNKDEAAIDTAKLSKTVLPKTAAADKTYIDETVFIGDSNTVRTMMYGYTTWNNVVGATSMGIQHVTSKPVTFFAGMADPVDVPTSIKILQPKRVIVTYGTNNTLGWSEKKFIEEYSKALKAIAGAYPYTDIIVNAIPPIDKQRENLAITMQTIDGFNKALSEMCDKHGYKFLNSAEALKDEKTGFAKTDFTIGDGVHLSQKGMDALFDYIKTHAYITEDKRPKLTYIPKRLETPTGIIGGDPIAVRGAKVSVSFVSNDYELGSIEGEAEQRLKRTETTQGVSAKAKTENGGVFVGWTAECEGVSNKSSADITFTVPQLAEGVTEVKIVANFRKIGLSISQTSASIEKNHTLNLTANIEGGDFEGDKTVTWSSTNPGVASVDANGRVTGVGNGQATIKASVLGGKITATCNVNVSVKLQSISIKAEGDKKEMSTKSTLKLSVVASPDGAPMSGATWSS